MLLAALGATLLLVVALARWQTPSDEHAYWLAGQRLLADQPLYDPTASANTPYAYWYPPVFAQLIAPISVILPALWFTAAWTILLLGCLWFLAGSRILVALALVAFLPVAIELWFRNVHLVLAVLVVLAVRRWPVLFSVGAAVKLAPGLGIAYLAARGRWRDALLAAAAGTLILAVSVLLAPSYWREFADVALARGPGDTAGLLPVPYLARALGGLVLTLVAARLPVRFGEPLLVVAITLANPTLWVTGLSLLVALVPIVASPPQARDR